MWKEKEGLASITCHATVPPVVGDSNTFYNVDKSILVRVPVSSVSAYNAADYWKEFTNIVGIGEIEIIEVDDTCESFGNLAEKENCCITYIRNFKNTYWQTLYVPFEIPVTEEFLADFEVADLNDIRQYDRDDDGMADETVVEAFKLTKGTLEANYPYLIRAKEAGEKTITVADATLYATEENSYDCSSLHEKYTFIGTYSTLPAASLTGCYALSGGVWQPLAENALLGSFRFYLKIEDRDGAPVVAKACGIRMRIVDENGDEEDGATHIDTVKLVINSHPSTLIYDLQGRRVENPTKGIYIINGKKVVWE